MIPTETIQFPAVPRCVEKAAIVSATPVRGFPSGPMVPKTPEDAMVSPVMVQTMMVSMKVPVMETYPCRAGSSVVDAAAEIAAEPRPLIRKTAAGHTETDRIHHGNSYRTDHPAFYSSRIKSHHKNEVQTVRYVFKIQSDTEKPRNDVEYRHSGNDEG